MDKYLVEHKECTNLLKEKRIWMKLLPKLLKSLRKNK